MKWIKFSEEKPPVENKDYLIAIKWAYKGNNSIDLYEISTWNGKQFTYWSSYTDCEECYNDEDVYAWMEIPECNI